MVDLSKCFPSPLSPQERLIRYLDECGQVGLLIMRPFSQIEKELELCHNTFKRYLAAFQDAGMLKYNLASSAIMLNPKVFRYGESDAGQSFWSAQYHNFAA